MTYEPLDTGDFVDFTDYDACFGRILFQSIVSMELESRVMRSKSVHCDALATTTKRDVQINICR